MQQVEADIAGILVTQVDVDKIVSYGGDYYYQGLYDYYGYSEKEGNKKGKGRGKLRLTHTQLQDLQNDESEVTLDLDGEGVNGLRNRAATNDHEFDMTTQVEVANRRNTRFRQDPVRNSSGSQVQPNSKSAGRMQDDLDFL